LAERIQTPDLIVYLRAETDTAMQRIAMRDRSYERNMEREYIESLNQAYDKFFANYEGSNILTVDTTPLDFVANGEHLDIITNRINASLGIPPYQPELPLQDETRS